MSRRGTSAVADDSDRSLVDTTAAGSAGAAAGLAWMAARGAAGLLRLLDQYGPAAVWQADAGQLEVWGVHPRRAAELAALKRAYPREEVEDDATERGIDILPFGLPAYPQELRHLRLPPAALFRLGTTETWRQVLARPRITIVGTREATPYGCEVARRFARHFAERGVVVVSGMARGVDGAAHRGALEAGGLSVAVLGCGVDVAYPRRHADLHSRLRTEGAVLSELPPGSPPTRWTFPMRNRILAAMGDALLVVEAGRKSGALLTVNEAAEIGRTVFVAPGPILGPSYTGSFDLLAAGAHLAFDPELTEEEFYVHSRTLMGERLPAARTATAPDCAAGQSLGLDLATLRDRGRRSAERRTADVGPVERLVETALGGGALSVDEVADAVGSTPREAATALARLELLGRARRAGPGRYMLID